MPSRPAANTFADLQPKLLAIGGESIFAQPEPHLDILLEHGGTCEIATGYGLYRDGGWAQHSWLWNGERVIKTNTNPRVYFGVVLTP